ncbi:MAG: MBOAT family O-acyltransferase [Lachnospiraceae bacterium]
MYAFSLGLAKKVLIANTLAKVVSVGYANIPELNTFSTILVMLSYSLQIYFDFSGYCDMALGISRMLNLDLPVNFNSPYKAVSITDFWDRWHMTLTRFFTNICLYSSRRKPQGTAKDSVKRHDRISGQRIMAWCKLDLYPVGCASRTFECAGKGTADRGSENPVLLRRGFTFSFVTLAWSIFRAPSLSDSMALFGRLFSGGFLSISLSVTNLWMSLKSASSTGLGWRSYGIKAVAYADPVYRGSYGRMLYHEEHAGENGSVHLQSQKGSRRKMLWKCMVTAGLLFWSILSLAEISEFLYFTF